MILGFGGRQHRGHAGIRAVEESFPMRAGVRGKDLGKALRLFRPLRPIKLGMKRRVISKTKALQEGGIEFWLEVLDAHIAIVSCFVGPAPMGTIQETNAAVIGETSGLREDHHEVHHMGHAIINGGVDDRPPPRLSRADQPCQHADHQIQRPPRSAVFEAARPLVMRAKARLPAKCNSDHAQCVRPSGCLGTTRSYGHRSVFDFDPEDLSVRDQDAPSR